MYCFGCGIKWEAGYHRRKRGECYKSVALIDVLLCSLVLNKKYDAFSYIIFRDIEEGWGPLEERDRKGEKYVLASSFCNHFFYYYRLFLLIV